MVLQTAKPGKFDSNIVLQTTKPGIVDSNIPLKMAIICLPPPPPPPKKTQRNVNLKTSRSTATSAVAYSLTRSDSFCQLLLCLLEEERMLQLLTKFSSFCALPSFHTSMLKMHVLAVAGPSGAILILVHYLNK